MLTQIHAEMQTHPHLELIALSYNLRQRTVHIRVPSSVLPRRGEALKSVEAEVGMLLIISAAALLRATSLMAPMEAVRRRGPPFVAVGLFTLPALGVKDTLRRNSCCNGVGMLSLSLRCMLSKLG